MRDKNKIKIVLSLLIALSFVLPTASVLGRDISATELVKASAPTKNVINVGTAESNMVQVMLPQTEVTSPMMDDSGCFPVDVTALSVNGITIDDGDIFATGTYPIDMTVCKTAWDPGCMGVWNLVYVDDIQEGLDLSYPRDLTPLNVEAMCMDDYVEIRFTLPNTNYNLNNLTIIVAGDINIGMTWDDTDIGNLYDAMGPIAGAFVIYTTGADTVILVHIPRDGVHWATCCQSITWYYHVEHKGKPLNYQNGGPFRDMCYGDFYPATVKKFVEIYKRIYIPENATTNETVQIYCEDFEDPCEIVENWATIDMPVFGANGALDTWTWTDKRYCSAGHSMHSTSFDTYLPDQYDILMLNFGGQGLDVSDYCQICIDWCQWIEGDAFNIQENTSLDPIMIIQDYGYFQYSFDGMTWIPVTPVQYYDSNGQTENIKVCIPLSTTSSLDDTIFFQWVWKSDPKFCYEGWYIDDVCIEGTICGEIITPGSYTWEFVYDSHSWPQTFEGECETYVFNETWIATDGVYRICGWLEALDECHVSSTPYDNMFCKIIEIGDILDLEVDCQNVIITPTTPVSEGTDVTIEAEICNVGTLDATNVQVNAKVGRGFYFGGYSESFEGFTNEPSGIMKKWENPGNQFPNDWVTNWNAYPRSYAHYSTYEASDGSTAIANFYWDETSPQPWLHSTTGANDYLRGPYMFTIGHEGAELVCYYDAKFNYGVGEEFRPGVWDWDLGSGYFYYGETGPYYADWATYSYELSPLMQSLISAGATPVDNLCLGYIFLKNAVADGNASCPWQSNWRGYMLDNIIVPAKVPTGEVVFDQTQVIPNLNITDCVTLTWDWDDVPVGDFYYCVEIVTPDDNLDNNKCCGQYSVYNYIECPDFYCEDYTGEGPGHWVTDGCCGGVLWDGDMGTTTYGNGWDDSLFLKNATGGINFDVAGLPITVTYDTWFQMQNQDFGYFEYSTDGGAHWTSISYYGYSSGWMGADMYGWLLGESVAFVGSATTQMRFRFVSNATGVERGFLLDNIVVNDGTSDIFVSDGTSMAKFYGHETQSGCWWQTPWVYEYFVHVVSWLPDFAGYGPGAYEPSWGVYDPAWIYTIYPKNLDCAIVWDIDSTGLWKAWMTLNTYYDTDSYTGWGGFNPDFNDTGFIEAKSDTETAWTELARDYGSANDDYYGGALSLGTVIANDFEYWSSYYLALDGFMEDTEQASLRFRFVSDDFHPHGYAGYGINDVSCLYGMKDDNPPVTTASMSGTFDEECHWYTSAVTITLTATDDLTGVCTMYYKLDGVVHEYIMPVVVNTDGTHTFCYWSVDCEGNVEAEKCLPEFRIDLTGPTVDITGPATGYLYLFGNQLFALKSGKTIFLFNGIPVTVSATANGASIATVQFFLDDVLMTEDTTAPYSAKLSTKHSGPATIKVTAIDVLGHTASDTLNLDNYLKLF